MSLVDDSLSDDQFFSMARDIVKVVYELALDQNRKPILRALAISVFRGCFNLMDIVKEEHFEDVRTRAVGDEGERVGVRIRGSRVDELCVCGTVSCTST